MRDLLDRLTTLAGTLNDLKTGVEAIMLPSQDETSEVNHRIKEMVKHLYEVESALAKKQFLFLQLLLKLARAGDPQFGCDSPIFMTKITIGEHVLMYYGQTWQQFEGGRCESLFGPGEAVNVFKTVCETLIAKILASLASTKPEDLQQAHEILVALLASLKPALTNKLGNES